MKIAVTYDNGQVFGHFGHCENFKIYEIENSELVSCDVIPAGVSGHDAMAAFLSEQMVDLLICGGIGEGARSALGEAGIEIIDGVEGTADEAITAFLNGELTAAGDTCSEDGEGCGCGGDCGCGGGCGGCGGGCGGCGGGAPMIEGKNVGKTCRTHYTGTFDDGTVFDSSYNRGEPLEFVCGAGQMILGFDKAVANMEVGEKVKVHLLPEEAYGYPNPAMMFTFEISALPGAENLSAGDKVYLQNPMGQPFPATVAARDEKTITFDANHEMAGKELNFEIELVSAE